MLKFWLIHLLTLTNFCVADQIFNFGCDSNSYTEKPAFLAFVKQHLSIPNEQIIKFDDVETNIGNHYNPLSGVFTTPKEGLYVMGCMIMAHADNDVHYKWMKNDTLILNGYVAKTGNPNSQTQSFVISLKRGDLISITKTGGGNIYGGRYSYMSGYLLN
uniref:Putative C1q domain containing protein MgC1q17 n=1 Tax=Mytilus galloprovincialis TaxID=29158 RepID=F0V454_MYTGA|nr:putative C1q domain containing protein MgC1q17 [Mytilus galloprovincialis]